MSFLDKTGLQTLTNKLVQGDAIKVASHRGHTVKNVIDNIQRECDNVANPLEYKIENRVADFKIGKGRDVDVSGDIENGCTEVELQGKTWQNILNDFNSNNVRPATSNVSIDFDNKEITLKSRGNWVESSYNLRHSLKDNTVYTIVLKVTKVTLNQKRLRVARAVNVGVDTYIDIPTAGIYREKFTTNSSKATAWGSGQFWISIRADNVEGEVTFKDVILLEGDHTQTPIEELPKYFDGIKSSFEDGVVDVEVQGKNLLNIKHKTLEVQGLIIEANEEKQQFIVNGSATGDAYVYFCGGTWKSELNDSITNTNYSLTILTDGDVDVKSDRKDLLHVQMGYKDENNVSKSYFDKRVTQLGEVKCGLFRTGDYRITSPWFRLDKGNVYKNFVIKLQIQHQANTSYEPCYKKKISFNIGEPLRSLPNGACDEIRNNNGQWELVRRVGKVVLNGSENWVASGVTSNNHIRFYCFIRKDENNPESHIKKPYGDIVCDKFSFVGNLHNGGYDRYCGDIECIYSDTSFAISIQKNKLTYLSVDGFKQWLQNNPTTTYYELATPVISLIEPIEFEIKPLGSININSDISPVSYHTVQLNRASQIERTICDIAELKNRVEALEVAYDSHFIETQHKLSLLGLEYEIEGGNY